MAMDKKQSVITTLWRFLVEPSRKIEKAEIRYKARLFSTMLIMSVLLISSGIFFTLGKGIAIQAPILATLTALLIGYVLGRTRFYSLAVASTTMFLSVALFLTTIFFADTAQYTLVTLMWIVLPILLSSIFLTLFAVVLIGIGNLAGLLLIILVHPLATWENIGSLFGYCMVTVGVLAVFIRSRNFTESLRLQEIQGKTQALEEANLVLARRNQEMVLIAELGSSFSMLKEFDKLLYGVAETIRDSFDLYYVQFYFVDTTGRNLVLRAGSGEVGRRLLGRGHRLPIALTSIVGTVATDRQPVLVEDTETSDIHHPNPLLPETRSEMAVPMLVGERLLGVLDLQSAAPGTFSQESQPAFEALAAQLAVSVVNSELFSEVEQARLENEKQARQLVRLGWDDYLDGIERPARIGYLYEGEEIQQLAEASDGDFDENALLSAIKVAGEDVGAIQIEADIQWSQDDIELVDNIAHQVAQQAENLRLLEQSQQYQLEAQEALRRLTREGWQSYQEARGLGFIHKGQQIQPMNAPVDELENILTYNLKVRDATIGMLGVSGVEALPEEDEALIAEIREQLSAHIENLRLNEQTRTALAQTDELYGISQALNEAATIHEILEALVRPAEEAGAVSALLMYLGLDSAGNPEWTEIVAEWRVKGEAPISVGTRFYLPEMPLSKVWITDPENPLLISDVKTDERIDDVARAVMEQDGSQALAIIPLTRGRERVGLVIYNWDRPHEFIQQEYDTYHAMIGIASPAVQSRRLFQQTQRQADQEALINIIGQRIQTTTSIEDALQVAIKELGQALGGKKTSVKLGLPQKDGK